MKAYTICTNISVFVECCKILLKKQGKISQNYPNVIHMRNPQNMSENEFYTKLSPLSTKIDVDNGDYSEESERTNVL